MNIIQLIRIRMTQLSNKRKTSISKPHGVQKYLAYVNYLMSYYHASSQCVLFYERCWNPTSWHKHRRILATIIQRALSVVRRSPLTLQCTSVAILYLINYNSTTRECVPRGVRISTENRCFLRFSRSVCIGSKTHTVCQFQPSLFCYIFSNNDHHHSLWN